MTRQKYKKKLDVELRGITHRVTRQKTSFSFSQLDALFFSTFENTLHSLPSVTIPDLIYRMSIPHLITCGTPIDYQAIEVPQMISKNVLTNRIYKGQKRNSIICLLFTYLF